MRGILGLAVLSYVSDPCEELDGLLQLGAGSFEQGGFCKDLFWLPESTSPNILNRICHGTHATRDICPVDDPVSQADARIMASLARQVFGPRSTQAEFAHEPLRIAVFGDSGLKGSQLVKSMDLLHDSFADAHAVFLLGDNFYPAGIVGGVHDPQFRLFGQMVARDMQCPFFAILGNHDHMGNVQAQLEYSRIDSRWNMPSLFYFHRFENDACVWFLDTNPLTDHSSQAIWLDSAIEARARTCHWLIVVGHHPVYSAGEYRRARDTRRVRTWLLPILQKHNVHLYLTGHEHQSQILKDPEYKTIHIIAGAISDMRGQPLYEDDDFLIWGDAHRLALLSLTISRSVIKYEFHAADLPRSSSLIYSGRVSK